MAGEVEQAEIALEISSCSWVREEMVSSGGCGPSSWRIASTSCWAPESEVPDSTNRVAAGSVSREGSHRKTPDSRELLNEESGVVTRIHRVQQLPGHHVLVRKDRQLPDPVLPVPELLAQLSGDQPTPEPGAGVHQVAAYLGGGIAAAALGDPVEVGDRLLDQRPGIVGEVADYLVGASSSRNSKRYDFCPRGGSALPGLPLPRRARRLPRPGHPGTGRAARRVRPLPRPAVRRGNCRPARQ